MSHKVRSPIRWIGGKGMMLKKLLPLVNAIPHRIYVEAFGGGASVLLAKRPSPVEVYNDIDLGLYDFFRVVADPELFAAFHRRVACLPVHRALFHECRKRLSTETDLVSRVACWFVLARQSFGGELGHSFGLSVSDSRRGMATAAALWLRGVELLPEVHARLQRVLIEHGEALRVIERYDTPETLFFLDPPYPLATRGRRYYRHEMTDDDHRGLIKRIANVQGAVLLCTYPNAIYDELANHGWTQKTWETVAHSFGNTRVIAESRKDKSTRTEVVWFNKRALSLLTNEACLPLEKE